MVSSQGEFLTHLPPCLQMEPNQGCSGLQLTIGLSGHLPIGETLRGKHLGQFLTGRTSRLHRVQRHRCQELCLGVDT